MQRQLQVLMPQLLKIFFVNSISIFSCRNKELFYFDYFLIETFENFLCMGFGVAYLLPVFITFGL